MEDGPPEASIDFIPTLCFVKKGIAKERPQKVVLTPAELARVINETKQQLVLDSEDDQDSGDDNESRDDVDMERSVGENINPGDEFNFNRYDDEPETQVASIADIACVDDDAQLDDDDEDSEAEDEIIKPTDNLVLVGHVVDDAASMEVWVFNDEEESFYTHHDFLLPSFPLCIEWLNHDPGSENPGNMCAIGCMDPIITIWDLDIQDSIEPTFKLGCKGSRKKNKEKYGHTDAVLDLSWNTHFPHILASGSVDNSVILWDLDEGVPHTTIKSCFSEKIQSLSFHATEPQSLLTGCSDGRVRLFDCRDIEQIEQNFLLWKCDNGAEVEKCIWNPNDGNYFITGTNDGKLYYADIRQHKTFLWKTQGHPEEISGICFNTKVPNLLTTTASDGLMKIWKYNSSEIKEIYSHDFNLGRIQCMQQSPDDPFTIGFGGEKTPRFRVYNIKNFEAVRASFEIEDNETSAVA